MIGSNAGGHAPPGKAAGGLRVEARPSRVSAAKQDERTINEHGSADKTYERLGGPVPISEIVPAVLMEIFAKGMKKGRGRAR